VREEARTLAQVFARKSRAAMRLGRAAFRRANGYGRGIADAVETFCEAAGTADAQEGVRAFMEKRSPNW
jgi:enoyl-CoA hydratase